MGYSGPEVRNSAYGRLDTGPDSDTGRPPIRGLTLGQSVFIPFSLAGERDVHRLFLGSDLN